ncbi:MAG: hypothetical protein CMN73_01635 [Sphingomonas sp.]|nr:hypothetical protein [Sphingomonas sp.]
MSLTIMSIAAPVQAQDVQAAMLEVQIDNTQARITEHLRGVYAADARITTLYRFNRDRFVHRVRQIGFTRRCTLFLRRGAMLEHNTEGNMPATSEFDLADNYSFEYQGARVIFIKPTTLRSYRFELGFSTSVDAVRFVAEMNPLASACRELSQLH